MGNAEGQARHDAPTREGIRVACEHHGRHRATGGQAGDEDAGGIGAKARLHLGYHLPDRQGFTSASARIRIRIPVETEIGIVRPRLLGEEQREAMIVGRARPAGIVVIALGILRAAVKHDDKRSALDEGLGNIGPGAKGAGIGAEVVENRQLAARRRR